MKYQREKNSPPFYVDLLETWKRMEFDRIKPENVKNLVQEFICKSLFRYNNSVLYNLRWILWGLIRVNDVWNTLLIRANLHNFSLN
jgi:hypothetical protein